MKMEKVDYGDIRKGDFIVRASRFRGEIFTQSGYAEYEDTLEMPLGIIRHYWYADDKQTLALIDRDRGIDMKYYPEDCDQFYRVSLTY
ncbi:Hypothetical Protein OBI_RACECAR_148 [Arthrobacter phage Racecar]|nr:hypothetical protein PBI_RACECAR_230 [Arthrobacter phage Racecar]